MYAKVAERVHKILQEEFAIVTRLKNTWDGDMKSAPPREAVMDLIPDYDPRLFRRAVKFEHIPVDWP